MKHDTVDVKILKEYENTGEDKVYKRSQVFKNCLAWPNNFEFKEIRYETILKTIKS